MISVEAGSRPGQRVADIGAIHIRHEMGADLADGPVGRQRPRRHGGSEIGPADPDIDDLGQRLAGGTLDRAVADAASRRPPPWPARTSSTSGITSVAMHLHGLAGKMRAAPCEEPARLLGRVDDLAREHEVAFGLRASAARASVDQGLHHARRRCDVSNSRRRGRPIAPHGSARSAAGSASNRAASRVCAGDPLSSLSPQAPQISCRRDRPAS